MPATRAASALKKKGSGLIASRRMGAWAPAERRAAAARMHTSAEVERSDSCFPAQRRLELQTQECFQRCSPHGEALAVRGCAATRLTQTASEALAVRSSLALLQRRGALQCSEFLEDCLSEKSTPRWWRAVFKYGREDEDAMGRSDACADGSATAQAFEAGDCQPRNRAG